MIHVSEPNEQLVAKIFGTNIVPCYGDANGMIDIDVSGGTIPYTITCTNGNGYVVGESLNEGSLNIKEPYTGWYTVDVTDANGAIAKYQVYNATTDNFDETRNVQIIKPAELLLKKESRVDIDCHGASKV